MIRYKPHLKRIAVAGLAAWRCAGGGEVAYGRDPINAYVQWAERLQTLHPSRKPA